MSIDLAGTAVDTAFGELFSLVKEIVITIAAFAPQLKQIQSTLIKIDPIIQQWDEYNSRLDCSPKEIAPVKELFIRGKLLVEKCSRIHRFNFCKKYSHSNKLTDFDAEVQREFQIYLPLVTVISSKATSLNVKETGKDVREMMGDVKETGGEVKEIKGDLKETGGDVKEIKGEVKETGVDVREMKGDLKELKHLIISLQVNGAPHSVLELLGDLAVPKAPDCIVGSAVEASLRELKGWLLEEGMSVMVVTAPGGCGKSTLLTKLCHDAAIKGKFKNKIMFVRVSKKPNVIDIVRKMIRHNGFEVPAIETEDHAVQCLQQLLIRIGQDPVLLVLDDVWADSQSIIEKFVFKEIKHYKIVVTSRYEFPNVGLVHHLNPLPPGEALELFRQSVTVDGRCLVEPGDELWDKIVNRCKGLPLALTVIAKSLRGMDRAFWETKLLDWSSSGLDNDILDCLKKSLDDLDGDPSMKERFMDLASFPEDRKIPATALIDMWVELYKLDFDGVRAIADLNKLVYRNLADLIVTRTDSSEDEDKCYSSHYAMQHDLLRELAIMECDRGEVEERERLILDLTEDNSSDWWSEQKQPTLRARLVSIHTDGTFSIPWPNLQLPEAAALVLNFETNMQTKTYALPEFIEKADKLKALIVTNYSFFPAELRNFHVLGSSLTRIRLERIMVPLLSMGKLRLHNLQKISFFMCDISQASTSDDAKISDAIPNLVELDFDYCDDLKTLPDGICEIKPLKKLSITNCHNLSALPEQIGESASLEVVRLNSCTSLLRLPDSIGTLKKLISLNISDCLSLSTLPNQIGNLVNLKRMNMRGCLRLSVLPRSIVKLRNLRKVVCDKEKEVMWEPLKSSLNGLNIIASEEEANLDWLDD
ncbi:probable disease resistance protein At5g66900 isoform X1 [Rhodamnia argentea]|uniref:Probable disease resistance protein At5g66900 isoform X1 n=1 Tax=Rhodamnia argentea TaxID=178133 RepID=A0A8B8PX09_9MYRT|nr:probable disease resistance protein At5g66900 isoform X1 [Rhodamnia argentea]